MLFHKAGIYVAIIPTGKFDGYTARTFEYPGEDNDAAWYFLNRLDQTSALEMVLPLEIFQGLLHTPLITQCAWCRRRIRIGSEWHEMQEPIWHSSVTHGICPKCHEHIKELKG